MKKTILFLIFLSFISLNKVSFSAVKCPIEEKTPDVLANYIKNVRIIEKNMLSSLQNLKMRNYD